MEIKNENLKNFVEIFGNYEVLENSVKVNVGGMANLLKSRRISESLGLIETGVNCRNNEFTVEFAL